MSVILITSHDESIYDLGQGSQLDGDTIMSKKKDGAALSTRARRRVFERTKDKKPTGVMGLPRLPPPDPQNYLKKNTWKPPMLPPEVTDPDYGNHASFKVRRLPRVPLRDDVLQEQDRKLEHQRKNFIARNVRAALTMKPKEPEQKVVLNKYGESTPLSAGLEPYYIFSKVFGKIPRYLEQTNKRREMAEQARRDREGKVQPKCRYISTDVRNKLLEGLKQNWEELQMQYQGLPILTDTIPKIQRKSKMEADLKQLEKDIVTIERHPYIYVYDDDNIS